MGRRTLLLITSILVAAIGTALVAIYVAGADDRADSQLDLVTAMVAAKDIPIGTTITAADATDAFVEGKVLRSQFRPDTITSRTELATIGNDVAAGPIPEGSSIRRSLFRSDGEAATTGIVAKDQMALSVQMPDPNRVAALIQRGTDVAVFVTLGEQGDPDQRTKMLLPKVKVIAVGSDSTTQQATSASRSGATEETPVPTTIVTFQVNQDQATRLILGAKAGELYLTMLGAEAPTDQNKAPLRASELG